MKGSTPTIHPRPISERQKALLLECIINEVKALKHLEHRETQASARGFLNESIKQKESLHAIVSSW